MRIAISFDYDSPVGYRESFGKTHYDPAADQKGTEALLKVLAAHDVKTTFAVVGRVALPGNPPDHCPEQIREILAAGHEVASHSMHHRFLAPMRSEELLEDLRASKQALEACIGRPIRGFIPPFNRPSHFPQKGAFSFTERLGLQGRGKGRQSVASLLTTLGDLGFGWCRISYQNSFENLAVKLGLLSHPTAIQPFLFRGLVAVPLHATGFGETSIALVRRFLGTDAVIALYAHPNQALDTTIPNDESAELLDRFLRVFENERREGQLRFETMAQIELAVRAVTRNN
ncbi:MAG TPA: polysaccharide deacetylase family protein [Bryobacteraceae bacterium]